MAKFADILNDLVGRKEKELEKTYETIKSKKRGEKIPRKSLTELLEEESQEAKLLTGTLLDGIIGGGLNPKTSLLLYGEFGSGKTQTCFTMATLCPDLVVYIDSEGTFRAERIKEICETRGLDYQKVFDKIYLYRPNNWIEQMMLLSELPSPADVEGKVGLVILDSLTKLFRGVEFAGRQTLTVKQPMIRECSLKLREYIKMHNAALIVTTQIYEDPESGVGGFMPDWVGQKPVGGSSILHQEDYIIFLRKGQGNVRIARLLDASHQPLREAAFCITEKGIESLPETERAEKVIEKTEKYQENVEGALLKPVKKRKSEGEEDNGDKEEESEP